ncbi:MAG: hypothetical protein JNM56_37505 [Planctomycetia bacterium]|nr:hypothetical protein [Planctomycetia bacterium]
MPITSTCPHCQQSVRFTEQNAGLQLRCPYCQQTFRADPLPPPAVSPSTPDLELPAVGSRRPGGAVPLSSENGPLPFMDFRAMIPPDSLDGEARAEAPPAPPPSSPTAPADERWWHVSQGMLLVLSAQVIFLLADLVPITFSFLERDKSKTVVFVGLLAVLICGVCVQAWGMLSCLRVPPQSGVRGLMHGAAWPTVVGAGLVLLGALFLTVAIVLRFATSHDGELVPLATGLGVLVQIGGLVAFAIGSVFFLICLRGLAVHFQKPRLASQFLIFLIAAPVVTLLTALGLVLLAIVLRAALGGSDEFPLAWGIFWNGLRLSSHIALLAWGGLLVHQLRWTIDRMMEAG